MTILELQQKYPGKEECAKFISTLSRKEMKEIIDSCEGVAQAQIALCQWWEQLTGKKYFEED